MIPKNEGSNRSTKSIKRYPINLFDHGSTMGNQSPSYKECSFDSLQRTYISPTIYIDVGDLLLNFDIFVEHTLICKISG